jgi:predicted nucleic acid-binding protein
VAGVRPQRSATRGRSSARPGQAGPQGAEGSRLIVVLDTGAIEGLAPLDEHRRARLRVLRENASDLVIPAVVLAEGVLTGHVGNDYHVRRLLDLAHVADVDEELGYAAGALRQDAIRAGFDPPPSGVDAVVAAQADDLATGDGVQIITSDSDDMELLASFTEHAGRLTVVVV